jgi:dihydrofolate reductase
VKQLVDAENLQTSFKDNLPGRKWFESFMRRHPQLSQKKAEYLSKARAAVTENSIRNWFTDIETVGH